MKKSLPWWQNLQIIAWVAGGLTAAGALIVGTARYINLPREVEAAQQKNVQQDDAINKLTAIQETWQQIYQQQQAPNQLSRPQALPATPQPIPPTTPKPPTLKVEWAQTEDGDWYCLRSDGESWWPNEQGDCE